MRGWALRGPTLFCAPDTAWIQEVKVLHRLQWLLMGGDGMERRKILLATCIWLIAAFVLWTTDVLAGQVTIKGTVNEEAQIVADDGEIYEVANTELGGEVAKLVGVKVLVMGTVEETEGKKVVTVTAYQVLDEHSEGTIT